MFWHEPRSPITSAVSFLTTSHPRTHRFIAATNKVWVRFFLRLLWETRALVNEAIRLRREDVGR